jgi:uncharacterized membrane protein
LWEEVRMKLKKMIYRILELVPLLVTCISLLFLPDKIPAHYNINNEVDRWGSKFETLLFPVITIIFGELLLKVGKLSSKKEQNGNNNNEKIVVLSGIGVLVLWNIMQYYFLYTDFNKVTNLNDVKVDLLSLVFICLGVLLIIIGNYMPKFKMNSLAGLRTTWSMKNEKAWAMSQKFGGISFCICGLIMVIGNVFLKDIQSFIFSISILMADTIISVIYSYHAAKVS